MNCFDLDFFFIEEFMQTSNFFFSAAMSYTRHFVPHEFICLPRSKVTPRYYFHCLCPWEFNTKHHNNSKLKNDFDMSSMSRIILWEKTETFQIDEHRLFLMMQQTECRRFICNSSNSIFIFFFFGRTVSIFGPRKRVSLFLHTIANLFSLYTKMCSSYSTHYYFYIIHIHRNVTRWSNIQIG